MKIEELDRLKEFVGDLEYLYSVMGKCREALFLLAGWREKSNMENHTLKMKLEIFPCVIGFDNHFSVVLPADQTIGLIGDILQRRYDELKKDFELVEFPSLREVKQ